MTDNDRSLHLAGSRYELGEVSRLRTFLHQQGTFEFPMLDTGLFAAARLSDEAEYTGYGNAWVRDNVHIAHAHLFTGQVDVAVRNAEALCLYFLRHRHRIEAVIQGDADPADPMNRPQVRFNGATLQENPEKWSHAQNDALGYFIWFFCGLAREGHVTLEPSHWELLGQFALYFQAIRYWQDEDSGHWEEARKVEASSIGTVVAGLGQLRALMEARLLPSLPGAGDAVTLPLLDDLIAQGRVALSEILPSECTQPEPDKRRRYDAALLFLIYPLQVIDGNIADQILHDVETHLRGEHGVRRYPGDSFWCADYKALQAPEQRTSDVSDDMSARDALLKEGQEAQWCIFDPILSIIYGRRYLENGDPADLNRQTRFLNRSLSQLTGPESGFPEFLCPELYTLEAGRWVPNDVTPLLWTQANLCIALSFMERSAQRQLSDLPGR